MAPTNNNEKRNDEHAGTQSLSTGSRPDVNSTSSTSEIKQTSQNTSSTIGASFAEMPKLPLNAQDIEKAPKPIKPYRIIIKGDILANDDSCQS